MEGKFSDLMVPPSVPAAATFLQVALKPLLTTLESLRNLTVSLLPLLVTFGGASLPHFLNSSEPSVSRTGQSREESDEDMMIIINDTYLTQSHRRKCYDSRC